MARLRTEQILQEKKTRELSTISALTLNHKALSDVSCLVDLKNLEKLDLGFNDLSSLEGLKSCINLKWLSVIQNKLQSLKGIEGLTKLTVLNAGKNKLSSMDEVGSLVSLRALILNDNEIVSICQLDQVKNLNTLVLSRNPVQKIGQSLVKLKSMTKLSLSNCQLQTIDSSLKFCTELKELRLAHNNIKTLPDELSHNIKLQNLDLGNNLVTTWFDLKVVCSLTNLSNLNLHGNPIAENDKLANKIKKKVPSLQIFNSKPINKRIKEKSELDVQAVEKRDIGVEKKKNEVVEDEKPKRKKHEEFVDDKPKQKKHEVVVDENPKQKKHKTSDEDSKEVLVKGKSKKVQRDEISMIDDGETSFMELMAHDMSKNLKERRKKMEVDNSVVIYPSKRKKDKERGTDSVVLEVSPEVEVGLGGPSTWD